MVKRLFVAAALAVVLMAAPAAAQQYPPAVNSLTVSDTTPSPGQTITIQGRTFAAGATVTITLASDPVVIASGSADDAGVVTVEGTIPTDTTLGTHTITAAGDDPEGDPLSLTVSINVVPADGDIEGAAGSDGGSGAMPRTGDDSSMPLAKLGLALAAIGGVITALAAKRRRAAPAAA